MHYSGETAKIVREYRRRRGVSVWHEVYSIVREGALWMTVAVITALLGIFLVFLLEDDVSQAQVANLTILLVIFAVINCVRAFWQQLKMGSEAVKKGH